MAQGKARVTKPPKDQLAALTGHDALWWMRFVQKRIGARSGPVQKDGHARSSLEWIADVVNEVVRTFPTDKPFDGNMRAAFVVSYVLGTWYSRVHHSKCFDPRRPKKLRQQVYASWRRGVVSMFESMLNEEHDPRIFNGIPLYENPFDPKAKSGKFV